ncbi:MAG: lipopolysaccharide heptosyltransferase I [Acidobacteriota bacterium]
MRILFVKLGAIGDVIHTLPSLAAARSAFPEAEISWVVESRSADILRGNPMLDNLIEVNTRSIRGSRVDEILPELRSQIKDLRRFKFDIAIDFQGLLKSALIAKLSGAKRRFGFSRDAMREPSSRLLLTDTVKTRPQIHVIRKNLELLAGAMNLDVSRTELEFPISTNEDDEREANEILDGVGEDFAILNPAGGWVTKLWPAENYGELADQIWERHGIVPVVAIGPAETELAERALASSRSGKLLVIQPGLKAFYSVVRRAKVYVGGDTGPTHIAVAAAVPIVGIFGPTEWWRNGSPNRGDVCVERTDIGCHINCHRRVCGNWICMDIGVETVFNAVSARLAAAGEIERQTGR